MKRFNLSILQVKYITTRRIDYIVGWWDASRRKNKWSFVCAVQCQLHNDSILIILNKKLQKLTMHIRECLGVDINGFANIASVIFYPGRNIPEITVICK